MEAIIWDSCLLYIKTDTVNYRNYLLWSTDSVTCSRPFAKLLQRSCLTPIQEFNHYPAVMLLVLRQGPKNSWRTEVNKADTQKEEIRTREGTVNPFQRFNLILLNGLHQRALYPFFCLSKLRFIRGSYLICLIPWLTTYQLFEIGQLTSLRLGFLLCQIIIGITDTIK